MSYTDQIYGLVLKLFICIAISVFFYVKCCLASNTVFNLDGNLTIDIKQWADMKAKLNQGDKSLTEVTSVFFGSMDRLRGALDCLIA